MKISLVCIMLWFPMKGLWLTGRREAEERNGEYPSISWTLGKLNERSLLSKKCKWCMLEKNSGSRNRNVGSHSRKACQTRLLAIPVLSKHHSETCSAQPARPDHSFQFVSYDLLSLGWIIEQDGANKTALAVLKLASPEVRVRASQGGDSTSTFFCNVLCLQPDENSTP